MDVAEFRESLQSWITLIDVIAAAYSIRKHPIRTRARSQLWFRANSLTHGNDGNLREILEEGLRGLRPHPDVIAVARRLVRPENLPDQVWDEVAELTFAGTIRELYPTESLEQADAGYPVLLLEDADVVLDLVLGPATMLTLKVESLLDTWRESRQYLRDALYLPSAGWGVPLFVESRVAGSLGYEQPQAAGRALRAVNIRYGFLSVSGKFPDDFDQDVLTTGRRIARERAVPGVDPLMPQSDDG
jgi:hypothetical protein